MSDLTSRESELVALGAALGSNCVPCVEYHIPQARKAGLTDQEIHAAIQLADKVRQVPAQKVLRAALNLLPQAAESLAGTGSAEPIDGCECGTDNSTDANAGINETIDCMAAMMSGMMSSGDQPGPSEGNRDVPLDESKTPVPEDGRGCC